ncbi:MAG: acyl-CoA thioesterase [Muribaculaceae bacterium]|nr:acyl-CoA thioesterase [Muribaculaceae bacterium]
MTNDYIFTLEIGVRDYELDSEGIVNNAVYLHYLEHTRHAFCKQAGYTFAQMQADGFVPVVNRIEVDYKTPLRSGDVMLSRLWVEARGVRFVFHQDIFNRSTEALAVRAVVSIVCLENGQLGRGEQLRKAFAKYLATP